MSEIWCQRCGQETQEVKYFCEVCKDVYCSLECAQVMGSMDIDTETGNMGWVCDECCDSY